MADARIIGQLGDDHAAVGVPDEDNRVVQVVEHPTHMGRIRAQITQEAGSVPALGS